MLRDRLITGALLIAGLLGLLWLDAWATGLIMEHGDRAPAWAGGGTGLVLVLAVVLVLAPIAAVELARLLRAAGVAAPSWLTVLAAVAGAAIMRIAAAAEGPGSALALVGTVAWGVLALAFIVHARHRQVEGVAAATAGTLFSFVYIGVMLGVWVLMRGEVSGWVLAGAVLTVKASDSGAYFTGRLCGRTKLIPWLSPGKTWEGFFGGIAASALAGGVLAWWSMSLPSPADHVPVVLGALTGAALGVVGPFGDLVESLLKRAARAKDSGALLPGMGGALDVLDSVLLAGPVVYWALQFRTPAT